MKKIQKTGFTLVELLVVIGIIALLISILLPSLSRARESAVTVQCLARMRELSNAAQMFASENKGSFPPIWVGSATNYTFPNWPYTGPCIYPFDVTTQQKVRDYGYLSKYMGKAYDYRKYVCPLLESSVVVSTQGNHSYGYNRYIGGAPSNWYSLSGSGTWRDSAAYKVGGFKQASSYALFVDRNYVASGIGSGGNALWFRNDPAVETGAYASPNAYHLPTSVQLHRAKPRGTYVGYLGATYPAFEGAVNIAFADGSARSIPWRLDRYPAKPIEGVLVRPEQQSIVW